MIFCRLAYDAPDIDAQRAALLEAHKAHLRSGMVKIIQSGPLFAPDGSGKVGALVVFETADVAEVEAFSASDPYVLNKVYGDVRILRWDKTIG